MQLIVTTESKRERFSYFFRVRAERKKMSGSKGLKDRLIEELVEGCGKYNK